MSIKLSVDYKDVGSATTALKNLSKEQTKIEGAANTISEALKKVGSSLAAYATSARRATAVTGNLAQAFRSAAAASRGLNGFRLSKSIPQQVNATAREITGLSKSALTAKVSTDRLSGSLQKIKAQSAAMATSTRSASKSVSAFGFSLGRLASAAGAFLSIRETGQAIESWQQIGNRLRLVTDNTNDFVLAQERVFQIAQNSRAPLKETADLYTQLSISSKSLGANSRSIAQVTETIAKAMAVSGSSTQAASAALVQLNQAFASGVLRGQELNSVLEQAPALADAIARGLGVPREKLRELGEQGRITSKDLFDALKSQGDAVDDLFGRTEATSGQSILKIRNNFTKLLGDIADATGAVGSFNSVLASIADADVSGFARDFSLIFATNKSALSGIIEDLKNIIPGTELVGKAFGLLKDKIVSDLTSILPNIRFVTKIVTERFGLFFKSLELRAQLFTDVIKAIYTDDTISAAVKRYVSAQKAVGEQFVENIKAAKEERDVTLSSTQDKIDAIFKLKKAQADQAKEESKNKDSSGGGLGKPDPSASDTRALDNLRKQLSQEEDAFNISFKIRQDKLKEFLDKQLITQNDYNSLSLQNLKKFREERAEVELERLQVDKEFQDRQFDLREQGFSERLDQLRNYHNLSISEVMNFNADEQAIEQDKRQALKEKAQNDLDFELDKLNRQRLAGIESQIPYDQLEEQLRAEHQQRMTDIDQKHLTLREKFAQLSTKNQIKTVTGMFQTMTSEAAKGNRAMFEINKAAALGNAVINAYESIASSFAFGSEIGGPWTGAAFAAVAAAAQFATIADLASTSFGSSSSAGASRSGVASTPTIAPPAPTSISQDDQQTPQVVFNFQGDVVGLTEEILAEKIVEVVDRDLVTISSSSNRQINSRVV